VDFTVSQYGTDSSGRPIFLSAYMHDWWIDGVLPQLGFQPTIIQGAWMSKIPGGGAAASAGYHDKGGCIDVRVRDLTRDQQAQLVHVTRWGGAASWVRDQTHGGMDPHCHINLGSDRDLASGARAQWADYKAGGNGLTGTSAGPDYHPRPNPLVTTPPEEMFMPSADEIAQAVWARQIGVIGEQDKTMRAAAMLAQLHHRSASIKTLAAQISAAEPTIDQSSIERALVKVLGSLDDA